MADQSPSDRYKAEMPRIPGVNLPSGRRTGYLERLSPTTRLVGSLLLVLLIVVGIFAARPRNRTKPPERSDDENTPQIMVPAPASETASPPVVATESHRVIASISEFAQPWASKLFFFRNRLTGENIPALIVRLPGGPGAQRSSYWAFSLQAAYGHCQLEYIRDPEKLSSDYGFRAKHPMVGNPCSRTVFDPLRMANLPGKVWIRGAIVQGSDIRPPLGIEIQIEGTDVLATRME